MTRPFLQARWGGVFGRGGVAKVDCARGKPGALDDTGANNRDVVFARRFGHLVGWLGNPGQRPFFVVATEFFELVGKAWRCKTVES